MQLSLSCDAEASPPWPRPPRSTRPTSRRRRPPPRRSSSPSSAPAASPTRRSAPRAATSTCASLAPRALGPALPRGRGAQSVVVADPSRRRVRPSPSRRPRAQPARRIAAPARVLVELWDTDCNAGGAPLAAAELGGDALAAQSGAIEGLAARRHGRGGGLDGLHVQVRARARAVAHAGARAGRGVPPRDAQRVVVVKYEDGSLKALLRDGNVMEKSASAQPPMLNSWVTTNSAGLRSGVTESGEAFFVSPVAVASSTDPVTHHVVTTRADGTLVVSRADGSRLVVFADGTTIDSSAEAVKSGERGEVRVSLRGLPAAQDQPPPARGRDLRPRRHHPQGRDGARGARRRRQAPPPRRHRAQADGRGLDRPLPRATRVGAQPGGRRTLGDIPHRSHRGEALHTRSGRLNLCGDDDGPLDRARAQGRSRGRARGAGARGAWRRRSTSPTRTTPTGRTRRASSSAAPTARASSCCATPTCAASSRSATSRWRAAPRCCCESRCRRAVRRDVHVRLEGLDADAHRVARGRAGTV